MRLNGSPSPDRERPPVATSKRFADTEGFISLSSCFFLFLSPSSTQHPHRLGLLPFPFLDFAPSLLILFFVPAENEPEARPRSKSVRSPAPPSVTAFSCRSRYHPWSKDLLLSAARLFGLTLTISFLFDFLGFCLSRTSSTSEPNKSIWHHRIAIVSPSHSKLTS